MANNNKDIYIIRGVAHWAKVFGNPRKNDFTGEREWSIDLTPDAEGRKLLKKLGVADRLREPKEGDSRTETFISFRQREFRKDGAPAEPIRVSVLNEDWEGKLIGNGSAVLVKFKHQDYGKGKKPGIYIRAVRVLDLVPYVSKESWPELAPDDEYFANASASEEEDKPTLGDKFGTVESELAAMDDDLDDDVPLD